MAIKFCGIHSEDAGTTVTIGLIQRPDYIVLKCFDGSGREINGGALLRVESKDGLLRICRISSIRKDLPVHTDEFGCICIKSEGE